MSLPNRPGAALLGDIRAAAGARIKAATFRDAETDKAGIDALAEEIARAHGGTVSVAPLKSEERAAEKVMADYGGDWHQIKDIARLTIVVPTVGACMGVLSTIQRRFVASQGLGVVQVKDVKPAADLCGYSSTTVFVRTWSGRVAEIQINVPEIIYAKQSHLSVIKTIGPTLYLNIKQRFRLEGGMGHHLYEIYRAPKFGQNAPDAANLSKLYYDYFRQGGFNDKKCQAIKDGLRKFGLLKA